MDIQKPKRREILGGDKESFPVSWAGIESPRQAGATECRKIEDMSSYLQSNTTVLLFPESLALTELVN